MPERKLVGEEERRKIIASIHLMQRTGFWGTDEFQEHTANLLDTFDAVIAKGEQLEVEYMRQCRERKDENGKKIGVFLLPIISGKAAGIREMLKLLRNPNPAEEEGSSEPG